ncbi:hypothetical protein N5J77_30035 [Sphingobium yanoikuyae]|uniref:Uncharacterized protein n=1 Tax=Sphingobium yanoikuyae TaxID=13690 RepID=A0AA42X425_SPHYA|nr:hypothetical protein [Sphingobium yanoikuyae]MDH2135362.1 hypothetical protein [Sphingobium yanoikuyae]MDH2153626.1 hypothetical protein [Sphingobium yanoikuyae]MDH2170711.1 hypothetical protein [Sphingobium yanoikuyae]
MKHFPLMAIALVLTACAAEPTPDQRFAQEVESDVRRSLKDPDSANFEKIEAFAKEKIACGKVNAKNSFGGYTGMEDFSYYDGRPHIQSEDIKAYVVGSGQCLIASARRSIEEAKNSDHSPEDKKKLIGMYEKNIADIERDPTFGL